MLPDFSGFPTIHSNLGFLISEDKMFDLRSYATEIVGWQDTVRFTQKGFALSRIERCSHHN